MSFLNSQSTLWVLVRSSDVMTAALLLLLLFMSIFCWTVFLYKLILWRVKKSHLAAALKEIQQAQTLDAVLQITSRFAHTVPGLVLSKALANLKALLVAKDGAQSRLGEHEIEMLDHLIAQQNTALITDEESLVPYLNACAAIAPLLGLFGTIWGLINAFMGISRQHSADIAAVAPGIAQALVTTIVGLMVAIPALFFFYYLSIQLRVIEQRLSLISDQFIILVQTLFYDSKKKDN